MRMMLRVSRTENSCRSDAAGAAASYRMKAARPQDGLETAPLVESALGKRRSRTPRGPTV